MGLGTLVNCIEGSDRRSLRRQLQQAKRAIDKKLARINQPIILQDMVVKAASPYCHGESRAHTNTYEQQDTKRLLDHIKMLIQLLNENHAMQHCEKDDEGNYQLKHEKLNHISRLMTHEFYFYTKTPFTMKSFHGFLDKLLQMAESLLDNTHLLLSSFSVVDHDGRLLNLTCYIEGGEIPRLHLITKNTASNNDENYKETKSLFSQQKQSGYSNHASAIVTEKGVLINTSSLFEVETKGGARYTQIVEVCLDHVRGHAKSQFEHKRDISQSGGKSTIPTQVDHCVTSNVSGLDPEYYLANQPTHVDPEYCMIDDYHQKVADMRLAPFALRELENAEYEELELTVCASGYYIMFPPFGSHIHVNYLAERTCGHYREELIDEVMAYNNFVKTEKCIESLMVASSKRKSQMLALHYTSYEAKAKLWNLLMALREAMVTAIIVSKFEVLFFRSHPDTQRIEEDMEYQFDKTEQLIDSFDKEILCSLKQWRVEFETMISKHGRNQLTERMKKLLDESFTDYIPNYLAPFLELCSVEASSSSPLPLALV